MDPKNTIVEFVESEISKNQKNMKIKNTDSLIEEGIFDSMALMKLISFLEENFKIQIAGDELVLENFENIDAITSFVNEKLTQS